MLYSIFGFFASLVLNAVLGYLYNKGSLVGGIALGGSVLGLAGLGAVLAFGAQKGTPVGQLGAGLLTGSLVTAFLCVATVVWIVLYMRGDI